MPTVILFVSTTRPSIIYLGSTIDSCHLLKDKGHLQTDTSGLMHTKKIDSVIAARSFFIDSLKAEAPSILST